MSLDNCRISFAPKNQDSFSTELQQRVDQYFAENKISNKANAHMYFKTAFYVGGFFLLLALIATQASWGWALLPAWALLGFFSAGIGFNVGHDAIHGAFSQKRWVNELMGHAFTLIGANVYNWKVLHNVIHHSYTNIAGADGDLAPAPIFRFYKCNKGLKGFHRYQHIYATFFYSLTSLVWVFKKDFDHILKPKHMIYEKPKCPKAEIAELAIGKLVYFSLILLLPLLAGLSWPVVLCGFLLMHFVQGAMLTFVFQLGHLVEGPDVLHAHDGQNNVDSFLRIQLKGTSNFSPGSSLALFICGGLNHQIEHHLFPKICHVHYPELSKIVKEVAHKNGLPYHEQPSFAAAVMSHFRYLKDAGSPVLN